MEKWITIDGFEDYEISNYGRIKSYRKKNKTIFLKQATNSNGYQFVDLYRNTGHKLFRIHRLVAEYFIPNPENKSEVNHIDGNKRNNCVENLEWCTRSENTIHSFRILGQKPNKTALGKTGFDSNFGKPVCQIDMKTNAVLNIFGSITDAARQTNGRQGDISRCVNGIRKSANGYYWKYSK